MVNETQIIWQSTSKPSAALRSDGKVPFEAIRERTVTPSRNQSALLGVVVVDAGNGNPEMAARQTPSQGDHALFSERFLTHFRPLVACSHGGSVRVYDDCFFAIVSVIFCCLVLFRACVCVSECVCGSITINLFFDLFLEDFSIWTCSRFCFRCLIEAV